MQSAPARQAYRTPLVIGNPAPILERSPDNRLQGPGKNPPPSRPRGPDAPGLPGRAVLVRISIRGYLFWLLRNLLIVKVSTRSCSDDLPAPQSSWAHHYVADRVHRPLRRRVLYHDALSAGCRALRKDRTQEFDPRHPRMQETGDRALLDLSPLAIGLSRTGWQGVSHDGARPECACQRHRAYDGQPATGRAVARRTHRCGEGPIFPWRYIPRQAGDNHGQGTTKCCTCDNGKCDQANECRDIKVNRSRDSMAGRGFRVGACGGPRVGGGAGPFRVGFIMIVDFFGFSLYARCGGRFDARLDR